MERREAKNIVVAAERLQDNANELIMAVDQLSSDAERRELRRAFAELIADIEMRFVFRVKQMVDDTDST